jgi:hypothetical protein
MGIFADTQIRNRWELHCESNHWASGPAQQKAQQKAQQPTAAHDFQKYPNEPETPGNAGGKHAKH